MMLGLKVGERDSFNPHEKFSRWASAILYQGYFILVEFFLCDSLDHSIIVYQAWPVSALR